MGSFGGTIPVTGLNSGFPGSMSRLGERVIASRPVFATSTLNLFFGAPAVIDTATDTYRSVADFIAGGGTFTAALFAGVANREVKTDLNFISLGNTGAISTNYYLPNEMAEVIERGSLTVPINNGTPVSQGTVYVRIALNGAIPAGVVGGFEAVADGANTVALTNVVFRTGVLDAVGMGEITIKVRVAA